jgi:hypothetical protein
LKSELARWLPLAVTLLGAALVAVVAGIERSPLSPRLPAGAEPLAPFRWSAETLRLNRLSAVWQGVAVVAAIGVATLGFLLALRAAWRGGLKERTAASVAAGLLVLAAVLPLMVSYDVFSYSAYGRMVSVHHANPYTAAPADFPNDPFLSSIPPEWRHTPAIYSPGFVDLAAGVARIARTPAQAILAYKWLAAAAAMATILLVAAVAKRIRPERAPFAVVLLGWNPVVLYETVGGGHIDAVIALAMMAALYLLVVSWDESPGRRRWNELAATALIAVGGMLKPTMLVLLPIVVGVAVWRAAGARVMRLVAHAGITTAVFGVASAPLWFLRNVQGSQTVLILDPHLTPTEFMAQVSQATIGRLARWAGGPQAANVVEDLVRAVLPVVFVIVYVLILRYVIRAAPRVTALEFLAMCGWVVLILLLASPMLMPRYLMWVLPLAWALPRDPRSTAVFLAAALAVPMVVVPGVGSSAVTGALAVGGLYVLAPAFLVSMVVLLLGLRRRLSTRSPIGASLLSAEA